MIKAVFWATGIFLVAMSLWVYNTSQSIWEVPIAQRSWIKLDAQIIRIDIVPSYAGEIYRAINVTYRYKLNKKDWEGNAFWPTRQLDQFRVKDYIEKLPSHHEIYVNPKNFAESVMFRESIFRAYALIGSLIIAAIMGFVLIVSGFTITRFYLFPGSILLISFSIARAFSA